MQPNTPACPRSTGGPARVSDAHTDTVRLITVDLRAGNVLADGARTSPHPHGEFWQPGTERTHGRLAEQVSRL